LFWHLKAEMGSLDFQERFTLMLEEYLSHAGLHALELRKQHAAVHKLQKIAELIVKLKVEERASDADATKEYHAQLTKLNRDFFARMEGGKFQIPLNPKLEAKSLIVEKCKFMSSKKVPLWLVFENADSAGPPIYVIFKSGDDLRQDILTLQLLKIMDKVRDSAGADAGGGGDSGSLQSTLCSWLVV
jgi:phosphatidylinositol-4,5-bisphosphate 3-kinase